MKSNAQLIKKARKNITKNLQDKFSTPFIPNNQQLIQFLEKTELTCFLKNDAAMIPIVASGCNDSTLQLFCLPPSSNINDEFLLNLSGFLKGTICPVVLFWPWQTSKTNHYVALRLTFVRRDNTIDVTVEIIHPTGIHFKLDPLSHLIDQLQTHLGDYPINLARPLQEEGVVVGDNLYWTSLSLLLAITQETKEYSDQFNVWLKEQQNKPLNQLLSYTNGLLGFMPLFNPNLFYIEQGLTLCRMPYLQQYVMNADSPPLWVEELPLTLLLRSLTLGNLIYQQDYATLSQLHVVYGLVSLTQYLTKNTPQGLLRTAITLLSQLLIQGIQISINLYALIPGDSVQRAIIAPRYILSGCQTLLREITKLLFTLPSTLMMIFTLKTLFNMNNEDEDHENIEGLIAISILAVKLFLQYTQGYLPQFNQESFEQNAEEYALNTLQRHCNDHCEINIQSPIISRLFQQMTTGNHTTQLTIKQISTTTKDLRNCELMIGTKNNHCSPIQLDCELRFFKRIKEIPSNQLFLEPLKKAYKESYQTSFCEKK